MPHATFVHLAAQRRRLLGVGLAVALSVAFMTMSLLFGDVLRGSLRNAAGAEFRNIDFVVDSGESNLAGDPAAQVAALPGVNGVADATATWIEASANGRTGPILAIGLPEPPVLVQAIELESGRLPERPGEVVLPESTARDLRIEPGDTVSLAMPTGDDTGSTEHREFTVTGTWDSVGHFGNEIYDALLHPEDIARWRSSQWVSRLYVMTDESADPATIADALATAAGPGAVISTADDAVDADIADREEEVNLVARGVQAFALLTLVVAGIVVSNTFAILVAQRTREIALFRCAGATARQVRGMVLAESAVVGAFAALLGALGGVAIQAALLWGIGARFDEPSIPESVGVPVGAVVLPLLAGTILAILAAWGPSRGAMRIDPLQALRAAHAPTGNERGQARGHGAVPVLLLTGGTMLLLAGAAISYQGTPLPGILVGMVGGGIAFLGVMTGASFLVPPVIAAFGRTMARGGGVTARVAAANSVRNPRRTSATTIALVIGVTLVTMMSVGAASLEATMVGTIDSEVPWDIAITGTDPEGLQAVREQALQLDEVTSAVALSRIETRFLAVDSGQSIMADARVVNPDDLRATWRDTAAIEGFGPGYALVPRWLRDEAMVSEGDILEVVIAGTVVPLQVLATDRFDSMIVPEQDVATTGASPVVDEFWLRIDDGADADATIDEVFAISDEAGVVITATGTDGYRASIEGALDSLLLITTALLAVAVVIAVIGVSNTLTLSVIERTRESALLRSLGFTRRQLRQSLAVEGALLAAIGALIGVVLGTLFGWIGAFTVVGSTWTVELGFPAGRIVVIVAVALACGVLASVMPARRAATADPVAALAET